MQLAIPSLKEWFLEKALNLVLRASKVYGKSGEKNGLMIKGAEKETKAAYAAIERDVWMYSAIYSIATSASMLPFGVFKKLTPKKGGDYVIDHEDRLTKLFNNPNPIQTPDEFMEAIYWSLELSGKVFIEVVGGKQNPQELYVLDPRKMTVKKDSDKFASGYSYDLNGKDIPYSLDDIIFHRFHNPNDPHDGLSASTPSGDAINGDILANDYNNEFFANSAIPAATLETERRMTDTECDALRSEWEKGHKGKRKRHRVAILYGGVKFNIIQRTPRDMEFIKQKTLNREEILAGYGVPPVLVGLLESVNYGNSKEQRKLFWNQTMLPKLKGLSARFTMEFGLDGFKRKFAYDLTGVDALQDDQEVRARVAFNLAKGAIMTADEIRRIFYKLEPLPDGTGSTLWVPSNMVPAGLLMNGPIAAPQASNKPGKPGGPEQQPGEDGKKPASKPDGGKKPAEPKKLYAYLRESNSSTIVDSIELSDDRDGETDEKDYSLNKQILV